MENNNAAKREADKFRTYLEMITLGRPREFARKTVGLSHAAVRKYTLVFLQELQAVQDEENQKQPGDTSTGEQLPSA